jgi:hypothetical protein
MCSESFRSQINFHIGCKRESILFVNHGQQWKSTCISREVTKLGINFTEVNDPCGVCGLRTRLQWRKINWLIDWCLTPTFSKKRFLGARYEHAIVSCLNNHCDMHIQTCINEERSEYGVSTLWVQSFTYIHCYWKYWRIWWYSGNVIVFGVKGPHRGGKF